MASSYVEITFEEMHQRLRRDKGWEQLVDYSGEYVFGWRIPSKPELLIKVYTSIKKKDAVGRGVGQDAIRVVCVAYKGDKTQPVVKTKRVNRTTNWRDNLRDRVTETMNEAKERYAWAMRKLEEQESPA